MRFCANPSCRFHQYRVKSPGQPLVVNSPPTSSVEACALKEIIAHHPYCKVSEAEGVSAPPMYFCDVCHQAIKMVRQQELRAASRPGGG
jgi:hypothetical protein